METQLIIQKGSNFKPINSTHVTHYIRLLNNVSDEIPENMIVLINNTKYVVNKNDRSDYSISNSSTESDLDVIQPNIQITSLLTNVQNVLKFNLPSGIKYCITDKSLDQTCLAKKMQHDDEYYCDICTTMVTLLKDTTIYDMDGNKFSTMEDIKNVKLC